MTTTRYRLGKVSVSVKEHGWSKRCHSVLERKLQGLPPCDLSTVFRLERKGQGYVATSYYCETHLPDEAWQVLGDEDSEETAA